MSDLAEQGIRRNILFVDDEEENTSVLRRTFRRHHQVYTANSGKDALEILRTTPIDVIFADQRMPEMTGVEFLEQARALAPNAYRVLLTGYSDITALVEAINKCGVDCYLSKPWTKETLLAEIEKAVSRIQVDQPQHAPEDKLSILVVDDEESNRLTLDRILGRNHRVLLAANGLEAIEILRREHIDIAIVDQRMPEMPGNAFLVEAKAIAPALVKILITAYSDVEVITDAINRAKVDKFLYKPFDSQDIKAVIRQVLEEKR